MHQPTLRTVPMLLAAAFALVYGGTASAAAFQLLEQNASGLGVAYAGSAAVADNASTIYYNPAGMTLLPGRNVSVGIAAVGPSYKFRNEGSVGLTGGNGGDAGNWGVLPNAYLSWQVAPEWFVGLGISSPFGLQTKYDDSKWIGRYSSLKSEIRTVNLNPSVAYKATDKLSLGFGLNYQKINAEMSSAFIAGGESRLKGDDSAWGWNAGAMYSLSPSMRLGVAYRSSVKYTLEGDQTLPGISIPVKAKLELPDTFTLSVWQQVSDRWEAMGDLSYTNWSTVDRLNVISRTSGRQIGSELFNYSSSWRFAWGAAYKASDAIKYKFGVAYDRTPVGNGDRSARVPDGDRIWLSLGGQWKPSRESALDVGYSYLYLRDPSLSQNSGTGILRGKYDDHAHILGVQYSQGF